MAAAGENAAGGVAAGKNAADLSAAEISLEGIVIFVAVFLLSVGDEDAYGFVDALHNQPRNWLSLHKSGMCTILVHASANALREAWGM